MSNLLEEGNIQLPELRKESVFHFDTSRYPFREIVEEILFEENRNAVKSTDNPTLRKLHLIKEPQSRPEGVHICPALYRARLHNGLMKKLCQKDHRHMRKRWKKSAGRAKLIETYEKFVAECIVPLFRPIEDNSIEKGDEQGYKIDRDSKEERDEQGSKVGEETHEGDRNRSSVDGWSDSKDVLNPSEYLKKGLVYQAEPILRCSFPSPHPHSKPHIDADYHHQVEEVNFWMPLTDVYGTNTLYLESKPGLGDFHPLEMRYGDVCKFWGNQCRHYTVANETSDTRVSLDFRAMHGVFFNQRPDENDKCNASLKIGSYYSYTSYG
mmetsp:Transcript_13067/g.15226  ORF Transcript_13067/g.15226 Transcript_13067/m.15226 type:complete len:324 (-) Transcript_13067:191-1162(-)